MAKLKELLSNFWYALVGLIIFVVIPGFLFLLIPNGIRHAFDVMFLLAVLGFLLYGLLCLIAWVFNI